MTVLICFPTVITLSKYFPTAVTVANCFSTLPNANPNTNIYSCLDQSSSDSISFIDENEESSESTYFLNKLKATRIANINRLMTGHININSIRNKFEMLPNSIKGNLDILMISKTKLDSTFPSN